MIIKARVAAGDENVGKRREWKVVWKIETETRQLLPQLHRSGRAQPVECGHCWRIWVSPLRTSGGAGAVVRRKSNGVKW